MKRRQQGRNVLGRRVLLTLGLLSAALLGGASARTVKIISADTLELRQIDGQELVIITGETVELRVDDDVVRARRVEYNRTTRTLTLVGAARYRSAKDNQDLVGENLVVELGAEQVTGQDVVISDSALEIRGQEVERIPGQLRATGGYFTTCARCGRTPNDYAFRAERLIVYPGDRLVAYRAQLLLADIPVLFLPVVVLPLNDKERQPRLEYGRGERDGWTVEADLPFSIGSSTLGTTLLRYYQNRSPSLGVGVSLRAYAPLPFVDRLNLYTLANPKPFAANGAAQSGYDLDYDFSVRGRIPLSLAVRDLDYSLNVVRRDIGRTETDPERGVTRVNFNARVEYPKFSAEFNYVDRYGPDPTSALGTVLKEPEVVLDPKPYTSGNFSADTRLSAGKYTAQSNPLSRSATAQGSNITTTRLEEQHTLSYTTQPWKNADLTLSNSFTGRYYGTGARTVQLSLGAQLTQRLNATNTFSVTGLYLRDEGTSPFAFDAIARRFSAPLDFTLSTVPVKDTTFSVKYSRDFFKQPTEQAPMTFTLGVTRVPLSLSSSLAYHYGLGELDSLNYTVTLSDPNSGTTTLVPAQPATATTPARPAYTRRSSAWPDRLTLSASGGYSRTGGGLLPFTVKATVTGAVRTQSFSVYVVRDMNKGELSEVGADLSASGTRDTVLNPFTLTASEKLYPVTGRVVGNATLSWRNRYQLATSHDLLLQRPENATSNGSVSLSVGTTSGSANSWQLTYGGPYNLQERRFTRPVLSGSLGLTRPGQRLALSASVNMPGLEQQRLELVRADLDANWQFGSRAALSGRALYTRTRSGTYPNDQATDTLTLDPLRVSIGIGRAGQRPGAYLTGSLRQSLSWVDGVRQNPAPLTPIIGLTIDRCCWALQAEADLVQKRYRLSVGVPGQTFYPLFHLTEDKLDIPLLPTTP